MLGIGCLAAVAAQPAAQQHSSRLVRPAVAQVATPAPLQVMPAAQVVIDESVPATNLAPSADATATPAAVRKVDCIVYDTDRESRRMFACNPTVNLVMVTQNPADHCLYEIPLCVPACCTGEPIVSSRCGLFGRGVVEYCWPCGFRAIVKFRNIGDVRVDYEGD
jgi:hypothetical protein